MKKLNSPDRRKARRCLLPAGFCRNEEGYALALTLVALPLIIGVAAWVIDASRVTNLHTDLQNAVDAMALAGARELDGRDDAIPRAQAAIAGLSGNTAWFGNTSSVATGMGAKFNITYSTADGVASEVTVSFLGDIPASDDTVIASGACTASATTGSDCLALGGTVAIRSNNAAYARVVANTQNVNTIFPLPGTGFDTVPVAAEAVAVYKAAACDVTPLFICNPVENKAKTINQAFGDGDLYGRQLTLTFEGGSTAFPGNFGLLESPDGPGGKDVSHSLATGSAGTCYTLDGISTKTGGTIGPVKSGLNTRFGIYAGGFNSYDANFSYRPDFNVRRGQRSTSSGPEYSQNCKKYDVEEDLTQARPLPTAIETEDLGGGTIATSGDWDLSDYWDVAHGGSVPAGLQDTYRPSLPAGASASMPSRYDVYQYEKFTNGSGGTLVSDASPNGETGAPMCYKGPETLEATDERRVLFAAVLNCVDLGDELNGKSRDVPVEAFAKLFMSQPAPDGSSKALQFEIVDITGAGGRGTTEDFLREEAELVR